MKNSVQISMNINLLLVLTWRVVYIGQASDPANDQILEEAEMEDLSAGQMKFVFEVSYL